MNKEDKCSPICCCKSRRVNGCHKQSSDLCHMWLKARWLVNQWRTVASLVGFSPG